MIPWKSSVVPVVILLAAAGFAILPGDSGDSTIRQVQSPSQEVPWPTGRGSPDRAGHALPTDGRPLSSYELSRNLTGLTDAGETDFYTDAQIGDVAPAAGNEIVTSAPAFNPNFGSGALGVYASNGSLLWEKQFDGADVGTPLLTDLDGDTRAEVFVTQGSTHKAYDQAGRELWSTEVDQPTNEGFDAPVATDVNGDGSFDVVQTAKGDPPDENDLDKEKAKIFALDGRDGSLLFQQNLACQDASARPPVVHPVQSEEEDERGRIRIVQACGSKVDTQRGRVDLVQAFEIENRESPTNATSEIAPPYELIEAWNQSVNRPGTTVRNLIHADLLPHQGAEILALWENKSVPLGLTILSLEGKVLTKAPIPGIGHELTSSRVASGNLDSDPKNEFVAEIGNDDFRAFDPSKDSIQELWRVPTSEEQDNGFQPNESAIGARGVTMADLDGESGPEIITAWGCNLDCDNLTGSVRIYNANGTPAWTRDFQKGGPLISPSSGTGIGPTQNPTGSHDIAMPALSRTLVFSPGGS